MKYRNNKGITGIDVSVALIIIVIFVGIVTTIVYNFTVSSRKINRKAMATDIAIAKIENLKQAYIADENTGTEEGTTTEYAELNESSGNVTFYSFASGTTTPYTVETKITKYANYNESSYINNLTPEEKSAIQNLIKIVEVKVTYSIGNRDENVVIKTAITRED